MKDYIIHFYAEIWKVIPTLSVTPSYVALLTHTKGTYLQIEKTRTSLWIHVYQEPQFYVPRFFRVCKWWVNSKGSVQTARMHRLVWAYPVHIMPWASFLYGLEQMFLWWNKKSDLRMTFSTLLIWRPVMFCFSKFMSAHM